MKTFVDRQRTKFLAVDQKMTTVKERKAHIFGRQRRPSGSRDDDEPQKRYLPFAEKMPYENSPP